MPHSSASVRGVLRFEPPALTACSQFKLPLSGVVIFGREKGDILISDSQVSATHCQIQADHLGYTVFDMNSRNGTFVNGTSIRKHVLASGDEIRIGQTSFEFRLDPESQLQGVPAHFQVMERLRRMPKEEETRLASLKIPIKS
jgi:pSer/pThr/pTyr-binding forkhead associated (FHA) protein